MADDSRGVCLVAMAMQQQVASSDLVRLVVEALLVICVQWRGVDITTRLGRHLLLK
jgi:hypothetical protein